MGLAMPETTETLLLQQGTQALGTQLADATLQLEQGERLTDARVAQAHADLTNGQRALAEDIHIAADNVIREVSTDTQFLQNGQRNITSDVNTGFIGATRDSAATDRVVDAGVRHLDTGQRFIDQELSRGFLGVTRGQADTDRNVDNNFRWNDLIQRELAREIDQDTRSLERGQRITDDRVSDGFNRTQRDVDRGVHISGQGFSHTNEHLSDVERRIDNRLSDHDRRTEVFLQRTYDDIRIEAERTREMGTKQELETRLYLRDREDRTEDLVRLLADRNLDEMRGFERRSRDDETHTRDLMRKLDEERAERDFIKVSIDNSELRTKLAIEEALGRRHHGHDDVRFDPHINIDIVDDNISRNTNRNRNRQSDDSLV